MTQRHDELKVVLRALFRKISPMTALEPYLPAVAGRRFRNPSTTTEDTARADIMVAGFSSPNMDLYVDVTVTDTGAPSYGTQDSRRVLAAREKVKRDKYEERVRPYAEFAPFAMSVYGSFGPGAERVLSAIMKELQGDVGPQLDSATIAKLQLQFAMVKAVSRNIRMGHSVVHGSGGSHEDQEDGEEEHPVSAALDDPQVALAAARLE